MKLLMNAARVNEDGGGSTLIRLLIVISVVVVLATIAMAIVLFPGE